MQRKESCLNDLKQKILTNTCIAFYDKGSSFSDTLIRKTLFFSNIPIALSPKLTRSCIIISGFLLKGLFYTGETGVFEIDDESQAEIYVICTKKLCKKKSKHSLFIYTLNTFIEKEKIIELKAKKGKWSIQQFEDFKGRWSIGLKITNQQPKWH